ncbi:MAG: peptidoglycan-associated lipoprotein Pal [Candidatus Methylomirabilales bacterium]
MARETRKLQRKGGADSRMPSGRVPLLGLVLVLGVALLLAGCPKKPEVQVGGAGAMGPGAAPGPEGKVGEEKVAKPEPIREAPVTPGPPGRPGVGPGAVRAEESPLKDVFFDFDKSLLRDDAKKTLGDNIRWLKANPQVRILVEGHCDERGTNEYNLALGERRAKAVRDYLVAGGIGANRISTISYGEERPFLLGHDESAWKWNRRGHFVVVR